MNVEPPETLVIIELIVYKSNGFAISTTKLRKYRFAQSLITVTELGAEGNFQWRNRFDIAYFG
jgi:hypothetical protein